MSAAHAKHPHVICDSAGPGQYNERAARGELGCRRAGDAACVANCLKNNCGAGSTGRRLSLEPHLADCPRCRQLAQEIRGGIRGGTLGLEALAPPLPDCIGSYTITGLLGEGGQGMVYAAEQQTPRRPVALKVLKAGRFVGTHDLRHFQREIQSMAALQHPGIATIYEAGRTADGQHFLAMELIKGAAEPVRPGPGAATARPAGAVLQGL